VRKNPDLVLILMILAIYIFGLLWQFSASSVDFLKYGEFTSFKKYSIHVVISILAMILFIIVPLKTVKKFTKPLFLISLLLLVLVYIPGFSLRSDYRRWIIVGGFSFQPSELFKLALIIYASYVLSSEYLLWKKWRYLFPLILYSGIGILLIVFEKDLSTGALTYLLLLSMLYIGTWNKKHFLIPLSVSLLFPIIIKLNKTWWERIIYTLQPFKYNTDKSYQIAQSLIAIGSGNLFGRGYMMGKQKFDYIPYVSKDFIFSLICEESGFIGGLIIIILILGILIRGYRVSVKAKDPFIKFLSFGITTHIVLQSFVVIGVNIGLLPVTGLPFPFLSYGGTALLINGIEVGLLINASRGIS